LTSDISEVSSVRKKHIPTNSLPSHKLTVT